jgi:hypothetical protein
VREALKFAERQESLEEKGRQEAGPAKRAVKGWMKQRADEKRRRANRRPDSHYRYYDVGGGQQVGYPPGVPQAVIDWEVNRDRLQHEYAEKRRRIELNPDCTLRDDWQERLAEALASGELKEPEIPPPPPEWYTYDPKKPTPVDTT